MGVRDPLAEGEYHVFWTCGGMAYAADLNPADPQGRKGSSPFRSTELVTVRNSSVKAARLALKTGKKRSIREGENSLR